MNLIYKELLEYLNNQKKSMIKINYYKLKKK